MKQAEGMIEAIEKGRREGWGSLPQGELASIAEFQDDTIHGLRLKQADDKLQALKEADNLLARLQSPYAMIWNPVLRRNIKRIRKQIREALDG